MTHPIITVHVNPGRKVTEPLGEALRHFNQSHIGPYRRESLAIVAHDEHGSFLAGAQGVLQFGWLYIERLWVADEYRRRGLGGTLLERLENAAVEKGARRAALLTTTWQAPGFYWKHGYETVASFDLTLDAGVKGREATDYLLVKTLDDLPEGGPQPAIHSGRGHLAAGVERASGAANEPNGG